jgi:hypothetical protein
MHKVGTPVPKECLFGVIAQQGSAGGAQAGRRTPRHKVGGSGSAQGRNGLLSL